MEVARDGKDQRMVELEVRYYLEMKRPDDLRPSLKPAGKVEIRQEKIPGPALNRYLYEAVGDDWYWIDRKNWSDQEWLKYLNQDQVETWVLYVSERPVGYFELEIQTGTDIKIAYFGIVPKFIGQGFGGFLLTSAIQRAWQRGAKRVWTHTSSRDHPHALSNYLSRGFQVFKVEAL
jgi:GNAT superfamily N-acetyltransferase